MTIFAYDFALGLDGDLAFDGTEFATVQGAGGVTQEVQSRLRWWRNEWFLDQNDGTPYLQNILGRGISEATIRSVFKKELEKVPDLTEVDVNVLLDREVRAATVSIVGTASDGQKVQLKGLQV